MKQNNLIDKVLSDAVLAINSQMEKVLLAHYPIDLTIVTFPRGKRYLSWKCPICLELMTCEFPEMEFASERTEDGSIKVKISQKWPSSFLCERCRKK